MVSKLENISTNEKVADRDVRASANLIASSAKSSTESVAPQVQVTPTVKAPGTTIKTPEISFSDYHQDFLQSLDFAFRDAPIRKRFSLADGDLGTEHEAEDGGQIFKLYRGDGKLVGESWKQIAGGEVNRDYYPEGALKGIALRKPDGSSTIISFTESGYFKARVDNFNDGSKIATEYDDRGEPIARTRIGADGQFTQIE